MRVIQNNYKPEFPKRVQCEHCNSLLELEKQEDIHTIELEKIDNRYTGTGLLTTTFTCPCCRKESRV